MLSVIAVALFMVVIALYRIGSYFLELSKFVEIVSERVYETCLVKLVLQL